MWSFIVYTEKDMVIQSPPMSSDVNETIAIVLKLAEPLFHKGCIVWMDNFYSSLDLSKFLRSQKTECAGTLKLTGKNIPSKVKEQKLKRGEPTVRHA
jgi:transposase